MKVWIVNLWKIYSPHEYPKLIRSFVFDDSPSEDVIKSVCEKYGIDFQSFDYEVDFFSVYSAKTSLKLLT